MENLINHRGLLLGNFPWFKKETIEETMDYMPRNGDVIIASYPKTGSNWFHYIVLQILSKGVMYPSLDDMLHKVGPFMEMKGVKVIEALDDPRTYAHHYPYNMVKKNEKAKTLYIYRNPADTLVSYYHFLQDLIQKPLDFENYFEKFLSGNISYGSYFNNVLSYGAHKDDGNLLLVSYEKLHANRKEEILRIAKFLGDEYFQSLLKDESLLDAIIQRTSFEYMKKNLSLTHPGSGKPKGVNFFRKGIVGDGKTKLSEAQLQQLREKMADKMKGTEFLGEWSTSIE